MERRGAFTLVELLVVIGIISVLAAMLLPTLADALEQGRRVVCVNNHRQLYLAATCYAEDHADRLPQESTISVYMGRYGWIWNSAVNSSERRFLTDYANAPVSTTMYASFLDFNTIAHCPTEATAFRPQYSGYSFRCIGWFPNSTRFGTTRLTSIAQLANGKPKIMFVDNALINCHDGKGVNVSAGDGSAKWVGRELTVEGDHITKSIYLPLGYYAPYTWRGYDLPGDAVNDGSLYLKYPGGNNAGGKENHRRMYGYR